MQTLNFKEYVLENKVLKKNEEVLIRQGAYLPHWTRSGAVYALTFRLADSLPRQILEQWVVERCEIIKRVKQTGRYLTMSEGKKIRELGAEKIEEYLNAGYGSCWLSHPDIAQITADALRHFNNDRYRLHAWCIMPNHVHVVVEPLSPYVLPKILHSWKSFSARAANRLLHRTGDFWQKEYYDHLIRDEEDYIHSINYLKDNPVKAGLKDWSWVWTKS